jgi:DNA polymerase-3 subunit delta'
VNRWDRIVGQDRAVGLLRQAAERPVHSYLLVGPRGSGVEDAARCFAAALVAISSDDDRAWDLALRGRHPDVVEIDPPEHTIRVEAAREMIEEAHRAPLEGARKVIVLYDAERLHEAAANKLLKTIEEPPPRTVVLIATAYPDELLPTICSRCQRIDFGSLPETSLRSALEGAGVDAARAAVLARLAGGRLDRARALAGRLGPVRDAFVDVAAHLDGTGHTVAEQSERLQDALAGAVAELEVSHEHEAEELAEELEEAGFPERTARAMRRRLEERHRREHRRARADALVEGITALETVLRDALAGDAAPALNTDRPVLRPSARASDGAIEACREARQALGEFNPNEGLLLEWLLLQLPEVASRSGL